MVISNIIKYIILLAVATAITLMTVFIPIEGVDLLRLSDPECEIRAAGLPISFISQFMDERITKRLAAEQKLPPRCHQPQPLVATSNSDILKRLSIISTLFLLDLVFWAIFLSIASTLVGKIINFFKVRKTYELER